MKLNLLLYLLALIISPFIAKQATAQIVSDNTLPNNSQVQPNCTICQINGGTTRGVNLYHSFQQFSIPTNGQALFNNSPGIENILTRVTGNSISNIDGLISVNGNSNLFLINPNGIIFGNNASLNITGSFTATTANSVKFFDGSEFSAINPQAPPLLTISIKPGLQYSQSPIGAKITNLANLNTGQDFNFFADQIDLQGIINSGNNIKLAATSNLKIQDSQINNVGGKFNLDTAKFDLINTKITTKATVDGGEMKINVSDSATFTNSSLNIESILDEIPGNIIIKANQITLKDNSLIFANQQGAITINANTLTLENQSKITTNTAVGTSGDIEIINLKSLQINNSEITANTTNGIAGDIIIDASDFIQLTNNAFIASEANGNGNAGYVDIATDQLAMTGGSEIKVNSLQDAGYVLVTANNVTLDQDSKIEANTGSAIGGDIQLLALKSLQLSNKSSISASTADGEAGNITINSSDLIKLDSGSRLLSAANGQGDAGFIDITTKEFTIMGGGEVNVSSQQDAGYVRLNAEKVILDQASEIVANTGSAIGGDIQLLGLKSLQLNNSSSISASTADGEAGNITINSSDVIKLDHSSRLASEAIGTGNAGYIDITTGQFTMSNGANINVNSQENIAGYFRLTADHVDLDYEAKIEANTGSGTGGDIEILNLKSLQLNNNSQISASTSEGEAGNIIITASDFVNLNNGSLIASGSIGQGAAGYLDITTNQLTLNNGAKVTVSSRNNTGGNLFLTANTVNLNNQAQITGETVSGIGGNIQLEKLTSLQLKNNSLISTSTIDGEAGDITIKASDFINLESGSRIASEATGQGDAGFVDITTGKFTISNQAIATVSSPQGEAGYLKITANNLSLNQGLLTAETGKGETGENAIINLFIRDLLLMRNNSQISAQAFNNAQGGNIYIDAEKGFLVAFPFENSDINANAEQGNGGKIDIMTQSIFGLEYRLQNTPKSDITASSQFGLNGEVTINTLDIDPAQGILNLPTNLLDISNQIAQGCSKSGRLANRENKFTITGKGGLPSTPNDLFNGTNALVDLVDLVPNQKNQANIENIKSVNQTQEIVEAQGWVTDSKGRIYLVANVENVQPQNPVLPPAACNQNSRRQEARVINFGF
jgi:filamentous hemagglutinin family protein